MPRSPIVLAGLAAVVSVGIDGCYHSAKPSDHAPVQAAIVSANASFDSAYRRGDAAAAADLMTEDVVLSLDGLPDVRGRAAMRDLLSNFFVANVAKALTLVPIEFEVYGDVAYERGSMTWIGGPKGQATYPVQNLRYSVVRHRGADGAWRIHRLIETSPMPASR
jgi:uncharacterized protein (TIGR02246 family)